MARGAGPGSEVFRIDDFTAEVRAQIVGVEALLEAVGDVGECQTWPTATEWRNFRAASGEISPGDSVYPTLAILESRRAQWNRSFKSC